MGTPGIIAEVEPAAIIHLPKEIDMCPSSVSIFNSELDLNVASPFIVSTLRAFAIWAMPPFNCETILFLCVRT